MNVQTLRYYERRGLLAEPPRSPAGYRDYPVSAVGVLRFVKRAQELGFTLAEVEELLGLADGGPNRIAQQLSDRVAVIRTGSIIADLPTPELLAGYAEDRFEVHIAGSLTGAAGRARLCLGPAQPCGGDHHAPSTASTITTAC